MKKRSSGKFIILAYILFFVLIIVIANSIMSGNTSQKAIDYSEVVQMFRDGKVKRFYIDGSTSTLYLSEKAENVKEGASVADGKFEYSHKLLSFTSFKEDCGDLIKEQLGVSIDDYTYKAPKEIPWWVAYLPYPIIVIAFVFMF